jgi:peptidoglycan-N-acetylglucosamine deacetylase
MRQISVHIFAGAFLCLCAAYAPLSAEIEVAEPINKNACVADKDHLGVSRTVEIDTTGGPAVNGDAIDGKPLLQDHEVVLTFDDGPYKPTTRPILKALADECTKATFFMVGRMALSDPEMVKEVAAAGHTVGTHTWSHANLRAVSAQRAQQEIEAAVSMVSKAKASPVASFFRFPYLNGTPKAEAYLKTRNISPVWVDIDSKDYLTRNPATVGKTIMAELAKAKKGIILMHDIHAWTGAQLPDLLKALREHGYKIVHLVPKSPAQTIASYDDAADKAMAGMARRAIAWPALPAGEKTVATAAAGSVALHRRAAVRWRKTAKPVDSEDAEGAGDADERPIKVKRATKVKASTGWSLFN